MGPSQRTPKKVTRAIKYPGLGVRSVGPVGDFLDIPNHRLDVWNPLKPFVLNGIFYAQPRWVSEFPRFLTNQQ